MTPLEKLRARRSECSDKIKALIDAAENDDRDLSDDERAAYDKLIAERDQLDGRIARYMTRDVTAPADDDADADDDDDARDGDDDTIERRGGAGANQPTRGERRTPAPKPWARLASKPPSGFANNETAYRAGMWCRSAIYGDAAARAWCNANGIEQRVQVEGSNTAGGVLVPEEMASAIIELRGNYGVMRRNAQVYPMGSDAMIVGKEGSDTTAYFFTETGGMTEADAGFEGVELSAKNLGVLTRVSKSLSEDAITDIAGLIARSAARAMAKKEDECAFNGTGTGTYGGIVGATVKIDDGNHTAGIHTATTGNTSYTELERDDFEGVIATLPDDYHDGAKWYISRAGHSASMLSLMNAAGGNTIVDIGDGNYRNVFMGYPVEFVSVMNKVLTAQVSTIIALFGDMSAACAFGDRRSITLESTDHRYFEYQQIGLAFTARFDINVHGLGDTSDAGQLVALKTPGS